jgi:hypothetical protein
MCSGVKDAIKAWNRRSHPDLRKLVEEMELVAKVNDEKVSFLFEEQIINRTRKEEARFWTSKIEKLLEGGE